MPAIERNLHLQVPPEAVFRYLSELTHLTEFCPNMIEVSNIQNSLNNTTFAWTFKLIGVRFQGEAEFKQDKYHHELHIRFWGGVRGSLTWQMQPSDDGVVLVTKVDYDVPAPLLKKHDESTIVRQIEHSVECMVKNLKTLLEANDARIVPRV